MYWKDGRLSVEAPGIDVSDRGLLLGDAVFDTALAYSGKVAFEDLHRERMRAALARLGYPADCDPLPAPFVALAAGETASSIRVTVTRGSGPRGLRPPAQQSPVVFASSAPIAEGFIAAPISLQVASIPRNSRSLSAALKTVGYLDAIQSAVEAAENGFDDALILNEHGNVVCSTVANVFAAIGGRLFTPPLADGALPGTMRRVLLEIGGLAASERTLTLDDVRAAEAVILTNSLRIVSPIVRLGNTAIPSLDSTAFRVVKSALFDAVREACGLDLRGSPLVHSQVREP